ncbi:ROK family protein [Sphingomonas sp.]|uniref:ROK family protein n=1 Tax=Sphingomonas sp. TaxID=28214 RepID=UPI002DD63C1F|nr:ROK family protein [Sphingomonas sp.]
MTIAPHVFGLELGGTKCVALRADGDAILESVRIPTDDPGTTLDAVDAVFDGWRRERVPAALGIASFGPIAVDRGRSDWGFVLTTPKPGWAGTDIAGRYRRLLDVPTGFDTDVNAAALAEALWGGAAGTSCNAYITLGTGIGVGLVVNGAPVHGRMHPEFGHLKARRMAGDRFPGACAFHGDCIEGLISGPALAARGGMRGEMVPDDHPMWDGVAHDLGELLAALILAVSPERIALGGGIACARPWLVARSRRAAVASLGSYLPDVPGDIDAIVDVATLGDKAGPLGAVAVAMAALSGSGG